MMDNIKTRILPSNNYKAIFFNGKTLRIAIDFTKPITELEWPEFYDVKITGKCFGNCPWCYQDSTKEQTNYDISGIDKFFGIMTENQRPFQVAIGGGDPVLHPQFIKVLEKFYRLGIMPNYTTNGMYMTEEILTATKKFCGGVAVSCHSHLQSFWRKTAELLLNNSIMANFHLIISDKNSVDYFLNIFNEYKDRIDYFVLLPYISQGRAEELAGLEEGKLYLFDKLKNMNLNKVAFGANFYKYIKERKWINASLYAPESFSKYLDLKDMKLYKSSFNLTEVKA